ncbi:hypothetical protein ACIO6T_40975 [Streptomyces sp. NPDC087532]|uniref:hypothetical protein n=1 Tax=Streptomyces sp. NPDC087532 TaxID=3365795 RepID=UPI0037F8D9DB
MGYETRRAYLHLASCPAGQQQPLHTLLTSRGFREAPATSMPPQLRDDSLYTCDAFPVGTDEPAGEGEFAHTSMVDKLMTCAPGASWRFWSGIGSADGLHLMGELNLYHPDLGSFPERHRTLSCDEDGHVWLCPTTVEDLLRRAAAGEAVNLASLTGNQWETLISQEARAHRLDT